MRLGVCVPVLPKVRRARLVSLYGHTNAAREKHARSAERRGERPVYTPKCDTLFDYRGPTIMGARAVLEFAAPRRLRHPSFAGSRGGARHRQTSCGAR